MNVAMRELDQSILDAVKVYDNQPSVALTKVTYAENVAKYYRPIKGRDHAVTPYMLACRHYDAILGTLTRRGDTKSVNLFSSCEYAFKDAQWICIYDEIAKIWSDYFREECLKGHYHYLSGPIVRFCEWEELAKVFRSWGRMADVNFSLVLSSVARGGYDDDEFLMWIASDIAEEE